MAEKVAKKFPDLQLLNCAHDIEIRWIFFVCVSLSLDNSEKVITAIRQTKYDELLTSFSVVC